MVEGFISKIKDKASSLKKRIIFPEGEDDRILEACKIIKQENIAEPVLVGDYEKIKWRIGELGYETEIRDPNKEDNELAQLLFEIRKHKGITLEQAKELVKDASYFSTLLLQKGDVDGLVSGTTHTTADTLRPALQIIKTKENITTASSFFIMILEDRLMLFADCGFNIKPSPEQLAEIAFSTAQSARFFDIEPNLAFLSFSTHGSAEHSDVDHVKKAVEELKKFNPDFKFDGELQVDAAIVPSIAEKKAPSSVLKGEANILIFPDLNSGNISYKLVQRLAGAKAIGPIVQGLNKPVNDLSRGCSVEDIVNVVAITAVQAEGK